MYVFIHVQLIYVWINLNSYTCKYNYVPSSMQIKHTVNPLNNHKIRFFVIVLIRYCCFYIVYIKTLKCVTISNYFLNNIILNYN